jgi:cbb3-type cytochrome oxidase maturation protein
MQMSAIVSSAMNIPPAVLVLFGVALGGACLALAAFVWAVRSGQLDPTNAGAHVIFRDGDEERR